MVMDEQLICNKRASTARPYRRGLRRVKVWRKCDKAGKLVGYGGGVERRREPVFVGKFRKPSVRPPRITPYRPLQHLRQMSRLARRAVADLVAATGAVGDQQRIGIGGTYLG